MSYLVVRSPSAEQKRMMKRPPPCNQRPPKSILIKNEKRASVNHAGYNNNLSSGTSTSGSYSTPHLNYNSIGTTPETANTSRSASMWRHGKGVNRYHKKNDWDTFMKQSNSSIVKQLEGRPPRAQISEATDEGDSQPPVPVVGSRVPSMSTSNDDWDKNCGVGKQKKKKKKTNRQQEQEKEQHSEDSFLRVSDEDSFIYGAPFAADKSASTSTGGSSTTGTGNSSTIQDDSLSMLSEGIIIRSPYSCATTRCNSFTQKEGGGEGEEQRQPQPQWKESHCYHDPRPSAKKQQQQHPDDAIALGDRMFSCFSPKNDTIDYDEILQSRSPTTDDDGYDPNNKKKNLPPMNKDGSNALDAACDPVEDIVCSAKTTPSLKQTASGALLLQSQRRQQQRQRYAVDEKILPNINKKEIYVLVEEKEDEAEEEDEEEDNTNEPEMQGGDDHVIVKRIQASPNTTPSEPTPTMSNKRSNDDNFEQRRTMNDLTNIHASNNNQQQIVIAAASSFQRKDCLDHAFEWTTNNATNDRSYYDQHSMKQKDVLDNVCGGVDDVACHDDYDDEGDFDDGVVLADNMQNVNSTSSRRDQLPNDRMMKPAAETHHVSTAVGKQYGSDDDPLDYVFGNFEKALCIETNQNLNQYPKHDMLDKVCQPMDDALCKTDKETIGAELDTLVKLHRIGEISTANEDRAVEDNKAENIENKEENENLKYNTCDDDMEKSNSLSKGSPEPLSIEKQTINSPLGRAIGNGNPMVGTEKEREEEVETIYRYDCGESNFWYSRGTVDLVFDGFEEQVCNSGLKKSLYDEFQENLKRNEKRKLPSKANTQHSAAVKFQNMYIHNHNPRRGLFQRMIKKGKSKARFLANTQASF